VEESQVAAPARGTASMPQAEARPALLEPIAPSRYKVEFTASAELRDKLQRARALLRHKISDSSNDLAEVVDEAVTLLLAKLEARKFAKTKAPRKSVAESDTSASSRTIPAAVRREVFARDEGRCAFVAKSGRRCSCSDPGQLEYHHVQPYAMGGDHKPETIELRCAAHNAYQAELDYGQKVMKLARDAPRKGSTRASEPAPMPRWPADYLSRPGGREWPVKARAGAGGPQKGPRSLAPAVNAAGGGRPLAAPRVTAA
jgi:5-methylcytosine-specific restriction endonuclease McrA